MEFDWAAAGGRGTPLPFGPNNLQEEESLSKREQGGRVSPQPVSDEHWPGGQDPQGRVVLLGNQLQVVRVLPLPLGPPILKPNFDLKRNI